MPVIETELAIVGGGSAGLSAAVEAARLGVRALVVDERSRPGGSLLGHLQPDPRTESAWLSGPALAEELVRQARGAGVRFLTGAEVWGLWPGWKLTIGGPGSKAGDTVLARSVLVATGAAENGMPFPGWTLPGVIASRAVQVMLHQHRVLPGRRVLVVGSDAQALSVAFDLRRCGAEVVGVVLPPPGPAAGDAADPGLALARIAQWPAAASKELRAVAAAAGRDVSAFPVSGVECGGVPLLFRRCILAACGEQEVAHAVLGELTAEGQIVPGSAKTVEVDAVCISGGLYPLAELMEATQACQLVHLPELGGRVPLFGPQMQTTASGLFVAGSCCGVIGADVSRAQGLLAGVGIAAWLGRIEGSMARDLLAAAAASVRTAHEELFPAPSPDSALGWTRMATLWRQVGSSATRAGPVHSIE